MTCELEYSRLRVRRNTEPGFSFDVTPETITQETVTSQPMDRFNLVDAAQQVTPVTELWTLKNTDAILLIMVPFNATQAYYYDLAPSGDDATVIRNCFRRLYTRPTPTTLTTGTNQSLVKTATNLETAIRCRKAGSTDPFRFFPQHESINTCFLVGSRVFKRNGVVFAANDAGYVSSQSASVEATYNCIHPDFVDPLATLFLRHTVTPQKIVAEVEFTFLEDTEIDVGYSIMNNTTLTPKSAAVGIGRQITGVALTGGNQVAPGQDQITNCTMGQTGDSTVLIADWSSNFSDVMNGNATASPTLRQWFVASTSKYYNQPFQSVTIEAGESFAWQGEFRMAEWASLFNGGVI